MGAELSPDALRKLVGVLGMLGSNHPGERDAAAQLANRLIRGAGLTWGELIAVPELEANPHRNPPPHRPSPGPASWRELARRCAAYPEWLDTWERGFLAGLARRGRFSAEEGGGFHPISADLPPRGGGVLVGGGRARARRGGGGGVQIFFFLCPP